MSKKVIGIVIAIVVLLLGFWLYSSSQTTSPVVAPAPAVAVQPAPTPDIPVIKSALTTSPDDSTDAALLSDLNNVDAQSKDLGTDSANVDTSLTN